MVGLTFAGVPNLNVILNHQNFQGAEAKNYLFTHIHSENDIVSEIRFMQGYAKCFLGSIIKNLVAFIKSKLFSFYWAFI